LGFEYKIKVRGIPERFIYSLKVAKITGVAGVE
jgi:hypothetical protein